jgi:hypothetical protein
MNREHAALSRRLRAFILAALLPLSLVSFGSISACGEYKPVLQELKGIEELKARFNRDRGKARIVLLLSPT